MYHQPVNVLKGGEEAAADVRAVVNRLMERGVF